MAKTQINPKNLVKVGRLRQVADSLSKSAERKVNYGDTMIKKYPELNKESESAISSGMKDYNDSKRYNKMIDKAKADKK